jgi:hypothetical protein
MGIHHHHERFGQLLAFLRGENVEECLHYPGMADVPAGFNRFARADARSRGGEWGDYCPAYAFALLTHVGYALPADEDDLRVLWDELGGQSSKLWEEVEAVVADAWSWLRQEAQEPQQPRTH